MIFPSLNPRNISPERGSRTYPRDPSQEHLCNASGALRDRGCERGSDSGSAAPAPPRCCKAAAWENGYFMNGRAAAPTAQAQPPYSMNGWAPRRHGACAAPFYEWGAGERLAASRGGRVRLSLAVRVSPSPAYLFISLFCEWRAGGDSCARTAPSARPEGNGGSGRGAAAAPAPP